MMTDPGTLEDVRKILVETLGIENRAGSLTASTPLFGSLPELDSLAVVELVTALEDASTSWSMTASSLGTRSRRWAR